jgi:hypothetical protein
MSGKKANNYPGLHPIKGQQPGLSSNTRVQDQLSSQSDRLQSYGQPSSKDFYTPGLLNLLCDVGNFGKISSACRQHEIQYTE